MPRAHACNPHPRMQPGVQCTWTQHLSLQVVGLQVGDSVLLLWAVLSWAPWSKIWQPLCYQQGPTVYNRFCQVKHVLSGCWTLQRYCDIKRTVSQCTARLRWMSVWEPQNCVYAFCFFHVVLLTLSVCDLQRVLRWFAASVCSESAPPNLRPWWIAPSGSGRFSNHMFIVCLLKDNPFWFWVRTTILMSSQADHHRLAGKCFIKIQ